MHHADLVRLAPSYFCPSRKAWRIQMKQFASGFGALHSVHRASTQGAGEALSQDFFLRKSLGRFRPRHPVLGAAGSRVALAFAELYFRRKQIHRSTSHFAAERQQELAARLALGETAYLPASASAAFTTAASLLSKYHPTPGCGSSATTKKSGSRVESTQTIIQARRSKL